MEKDGRQVPQGEPMTPPEDPPESKVPNKFSEAANAANGGKVNDDAGNHWDEALSDEKAAEFIDEYGLKPYLMWRMLHGLPIGQDH